MNLFYSTVKRVSSITLILICIFLAKMPTAFAQPSGFVDQEFVGGFEQAVGLTFDANGRMYVWEKQGKVWIVENGVKSASPLIDISEEVGNWRDFGLLGFALDPNFLSNGKFYLLYMVDRHHMLYFGTNNYDPNANEYLDATIGRITQYTATAASNFTVTNYNSRNVLLGETIADGFPNLHQSHGTGHLVFGEDGTLLASFGDGASYSSVDQGSASETYYQQAIADGIIPSSHNIGAYRSQILDSYAGKIIRIDPETGLGISSNPFYQSGNPNSKQSKVWARGLRNPCRFAKRPGTGSHDPAEGNPGVFYIGDVGWSTREELNVMDEGGLNFGWPKYEGMTNQPGYNNNTYTPSTHELAKIDWRNGTARASVNGTIYNIGSSQVPGPSFTGNCSMGGIWYTGTDFPVEYQNTYFHADYGGDWIRNFSFNNNNNPTQSRAFKTGANAVTFIATSPIDGGLYYIGGTAGNSNPLANAVQKISYTANNNLPPTANITANFLYGNSPLTVELFGSQSYDGDGDNLSYSWDFGNGTTSNSINPIHTFTSSTSNPSSFTVTLTVSDGNLSDSESIVISLNNTPPVIVSTSIDNTNTYSSTSSTTLNLNAVINDAEHTNSSLTYQWFTELHHNDHFHSEPVDNNANTSVALSPVGCDGSTYFYRIKLVVTDPGGLFSIYQKDIYPTCSGAVQNLTFSNVPDKLTTDAPFNLSATTNSGLPISYHVVSGPATISGNTVTLTGDPGELTLIAIQGGNGTYQPAIPIEQIVQVNVPSGDCAGLGAISREVWNNIGTSNFISDIPLATTPDIEDELNIFEIPVNAAEQYGTRLRGYICPPVTGDYTFWISSDDNGELWLSSNNDPANKSLIANVPLWSNSREWNKFPEQQSTTINLVAGERYYVEALMKEGSGGDNLAVGWQLPDGSLNRPISGQYLLPWDGGVSSQPIGFTIETNLLTAGHHSGVAMGITDMNGDKKDDIVRLDDAKNLNIQYQNSPNNAFGNYSFGAVSTGNEWSLCIGDVDENGYNDILVGGNYDNIKLLKANGIGSNYASSTLPSSAIFLQGSNFVDINNDGAIDVFACHDDAESQKWENDGNGIFTLNNNLIPTITVPSSDNSGNYASIWTDYDNDDDLDLYISKCRGGVADPTDPRRVNMLFQNDGNNNFTEVAGAAGLKIGDQTWSTDFADIDNDGDMDCFMLNHYTPSLLFRNNGNGTFTDITTGSGLDTDLDLFGIQGIFRDFDNDGFVDLVVTGSEHRMYKGNGNGTFTQLSNPFTTNWIESLAIGDLNDDGFLDIYAGYANFFTNPSTIDDELFMNVGNANNHIKIHLEGTVSNSNGIGARVELHGAWGTQIREVRSGEGYGIHNSLQQHFGIGSASQITKVVVKWPSGIVNEVLSPNINQTLTIIESQPTQSQTIIFNALADKLTTDNPFTVSATASSGLPVSFSIVSGPATISGNTITLNGNTGTVVVRASQVGNNQYDSAPNVNRSFEVTEPSTGGCTTLTNLALNKPATQSGTQFNAEASRAIDGDTNGDFWGGNSTSLTNWQVNAWWEVDLQVLGQIEEIKTYNRTDCCTEHFANFYIFVSDVPFTSNNLNTTLNQSGVSNYFITGESEIPTVQNINRTGRYVRIQLAGQAFLAIPEVEIMGCIGGGGGPVGQTIAFNAIPDLYNNAAPITLSATATSSLPVSYSVISGPAVVSGNVLTLTGTTGTVTVQASQAGNAQFNPATSVNRSFTVTEAPVGGCGGNTTNLALNKPSTQSGTQLNAEAERANDGNTNGNFWGGNSVTLTNWVQNAWWEVDLETVANIETVDVWNRTDCCTELFGDFYVLVSDVPFTSTNLNTTLAQAGVSDYLVSGTADLPSTVTVNRTGRYVRIQLVGQAFLAIAEVEINGCAGGGGCPFAGTPCNDNDATTENDVEDGNCNCAGTPCPIVGTACNDNNPNTENDIEDGECNCAGTVIGCPAAGTPCDDNDPTTENDLEDGNCNCAGTPINAGCTSTTNFALNGTASQFSTISVAGITGSADKAIDGNTNGTFFTSPASASSTSATSYSNEAWWQVDLGVVYFIENINVWNRTDGTDKTTDAYVLISNTPFTSNDLAGARVEASYEFFIAGLVGSPTIVAPSIQGRYVRIQRSTPGYLVMGEVEVEGCVDPIVIEPTPQSSLIVPSNEVVLEARVFPNPAEKNITVEFDTPRDTNVRTFVTDSRGARVYTNEFYSYAGQHSFVVDISNFPVGNYILYLEHGDLKKAIQFVKIAE